MGRRSLLIAASVLVAALGTSLIWLYVQGADQRAVDRSQLVTVLRAESAAEPGTPTRQLRVSVSRIPAAEARSAVTDRRQLADQVTATRVFPGQLLTREMFLAQAPPPVAATNVAVSITVQDPDRVPALLRPGQLVAVYKVPPQGPVELVVPSARVSAVGSEISGAPAPTRGRSGQPERAAATVVTFDVPPPVSVRIAGIVGSGGRPLLMVLGADAEAAGGRPSPSPSPTS